MKILITGYTGRMCGSKYLRYDYKTFSLLLPKILEEMGHEVHHRKILIGEELYSKYDYAFVGLAPLNSITAGQVPESHYVLDVMTGRCACFFDDWSAAGWGDSVRYTVDRWEKYLAYRRFKYDHKVMDKTRESMVNLVTFPREHNPPLVAPLFTWGDHQFLVRNNYQTTLIDIDPSAWMTYPSVNIPKPIERKRHWVMAALSDHTGWVRKQCFTLPVYYVGNKRMNGSLVLNEGETIALFAQSFGVLSCGYPSAGSGWWRTRYLNCAWAESLMYCDPVDAVTMGKCFQGVPADMERISTEHEYEVLAEAQASWVNGRLSTKESVMKKIERLIAK